MKFALFFLYNKHLILSHSQISVSKKQNSIFGEFFQLVFMVLHDNSLKNIGDRFFKFNCGEM